MDLERLVAGQIAACMAQASVGSRLPIDSASEVCDALELLVPEILRRTYREWRRESLDGFFFSAALLTGERAAELRGTCILISDQSVTPFWLTMILSESGSFELFRVRLGESGRGQLGISGPECRSRAAEELLYALEERLDRIEWLYDVEA